jgi:YHS domain-containing protein
VTLRERQRWAPGDPRFAAAFDGRQYTFASPREREAFLANPGRYVPALNGACLVTFHDEQRLEPGEFDCGLIHGGRLLFFAGEERRARFRSDPDRYANADLAVRGRCLVSLLEQRRDMPGDPRTATHFGGRRFLFVNAHGRSKFLADPASYLNDPRLAGVDPTLRLSAAVAATDSEEQGDERASADSAGERPQFAMQGYCPVSIRDEARWVRGRFDVLVTLGDLTFRCASTEHRERFAGDVARYVPALGGYCPVRFTDDGDLEPGSIYHSVELPEYDLLFMFAGADEMAAFKADPGRYAKADVAAGGACVVTQKKEGRSTPGSPRYSAWHEGLRYYFASAAYAEQFAAEPAAYAAEK